MAVIVAVEVSGIEVRANGYANDCGHDCQYSHKCSQVRQHAHFFPLRLIPNTSGRNRRRNRSCTRGMPLWRHSDTDCGLISHSFDTATVPPKSSMIFDAFMLPCYARGFRPSSKKFRVAYKK